jgi:hypothetical protein
MRCVTFARLDGAYLVALWALTAAVLMPSPARLDQRVGPRCLQLGSPGARGGSQPLSSTPSNVVRPLLLGGLSLVQGTRRVMTRASLGRTRIQFTSNHETAKASGVASYTRPA